MSGCVSGDKKHKLLIKNKQTIVKLGLRFAPFALSIHSFAITHRYVKDADIVICKGECDRA